MQLARAILFNRLARCGIAAAWCLALLLTPGAEFNSAQVKARYIHNFVKYIGWPKSDRQEKRFAIGIVQSAEIKTALDEVIYGKSWEGRPFQTLALDLPDESQNLDVLYIAEANRERVKGLLAKLPASTLTIGEAPGFLAGGGMIEFKLTDGKVRFNVNLGALRQAGFSVDARLLKVAEEVVGK